MDEQEVLQLSPGDGEGELVQSLKASLASDILEMCDDTIQTYGVDNREELDLKDNIIIDAIATSLVHTLVAFATRNHITQNKEVIESVCKVLTESFLTLKNNREAQLN